MKSLFFTLPFALLAIFSAKAQTHDGIPLPSRFTVEKGAPASVLTNDSLTTFFYNADSTLNHELIEVWDTTSHAWVPNTQFLYAYDGNGRRTESLNMEIQSNGTWLNVYRILYSYYPDLAYLSGQPTTEERQLWNGSADPWQTFYLVKNIAFGPSDGVLEGQLAQNSVEGFINGTQQYGNISIFDREETSAGIRISNVTYKGYDYWTGLYEPSNLAAYIYNNPLSVEYDTINEYGWVTANMEWTTTPVSRTIQTISGHERIQVVQQLYNGELIGNSRSTIITNAFDQPEVVKLDIWDWALLDFSKYSKTEFTYNPDHSPATRLSYSINFSNSDHPLYLDHKGTYAYGTSGTYAPTLKTFVSVFPNPAADFVNIAMDTNSSFTLFDAKGTVSAKGQTTGGTATVSLLGKPSGTYFLLVNRNGIAQVIPVVKK